MPKYAKWLIGVLIGITAVSVIAVAFMAARRPDTDDEDEQEAVKAPSHLSARNGRTVITLDAQTQAREGIQVAAVRQTSMRAVVDGTAVVLAVSDLATARNAYIAAQMKLRRDQVTLALSQTQERRVKTLYQQNQNMSLQAMQDADAALRNNQAQVNEDEQNANLQLDTVQQHWGGVVRGWVEKDDPILDSLLSQRAFLAQVVFPPGEIGKAPATLSLRLPGNSLVKTRLVSAFPQVNPQIQAVSFLYLLPGRAGMAVGMNLPVLVPIGQPLQGTVVPEAAVVWWQGKAWAYQETAENAFTRREVPTANPVKDGYFVPGNTFPAGTRLVSGNAQALLSEEFRGEIQQED